MTPAPIIRRCRSARRLDPKEIARLDADALRQRRRRAFKRAAEHKKVSISRRLGMASAAVTATALIPALLLASGWLRLDLGKAMAGTPRAGTDEARALVEEPDRTLMSKLEEISQRLSVLGSGLKHKPHKSVALNSALAASPPHFRFAPQAQTIALDDPHSWSAPRGSWSSEILKRWSERAGVDLDWQAEIDVQLDAPLDIRGSFEEAVTSLFEGVAHESPHPKGHLHLNRKTGRPALVVVAEGNPDG